MKLFALLWLVAGVAVAEPATNRPPEWAVPIAKPGLPNLHQVSPTLYRGAQPDAEGFRQLKAMRVKTIVNLRSFHSDRDEIGQLQFAREHIWFKAWHAEDHEIVRFLRIATDTNAAPVFVHCQHGADRTGTMCAIYRLAVQGWSKDAAIQEMTTGGYGYHVVWKNLIAFLRELDVDKLRQAAGLPQRK